MYHNIKVCLLDPEQAVNVIFIVSVIVYEYYIKYEDIYYSIIMTYKKFSSKKLTENNKQTRGQGMLMVWTTHFSHNLRKFKYASAGILSTVSLTFP